MNHSDGRASGSKERIGVDYREQPANSDELASSADRLAEARATYRTDAERLFSGQRRDGPRDQRRNVDQCAEPC